MEIIENERGNKTTPSYVAFTDTERLIGDDAKDQMTLNPNNTIHSVKKLLGRKYEDDIQLQYTKNLVNLKGKVALKVDYRKKEIVLTPEQISAMLLKKMKDLAENHLKHEVQDAVISVPSHFDNLQRQALVNAAKIAGLNVLSLINEPTAAAVTYVQDKIFEESQLVVLFNFGGGSLEIAFFEVCNRWIKLMHCDYHSFGGQNIDERLLEYLTKVICKDYDIRVESGTQMYCRLLIEVQKAKHQLSFCLLYTSPSPRDKRQSRMPSSA